MFSWRTERVSERVPDTTDSSADEASNSYETAFTFHVGLVTADLIVLFSSAYIIQNTDRTRLKVGYHVHCSCIFLRLSLPHSLRNAYTNNVLLHIYGIVYNITIQLMTINVIYKDGDVNSTSVGIGTLRLRLHTTLHDVL